MNNHDNYDFKHMFMSCYQFCFDAIFCFSSSKKFSRKFTESGNGTVRVKVEGDVSSEISSSNFTSTTDVSTIENGNGYACNVKTL